MTFSKEQRDMVEVMLSEGGATVAGLVRRLHLNRDQASQLLSESSANHNVTLITTSKTTSQPIEEEGKEMETIPCTVFSFKTQKVNSDLNKDSASFVYAVTPPPPSTEEEGDEPASSTRSQHALALSSVLEPTLGEWRDLIRQRDTQELQECVQSSQDVVTSAEPPEELKARWERYQQPSTNLGAASVSYNAGSTSNALAMKNKRTAVGASAFFNKDKKTEVKVSSVASKTQKKQPSSAKSTVSSSIASKLKKQKESSSNEEKENNNKQRFSSRKKEENKNVGTADDFVGDIEDSDDEDSYVAPAPEPKKTKAIAAKPAPKEDPIEVDNSEEETAPKDEPMEIQEPKPQPQHPKRRPRRKKLVQKTTVDAHGYLHTETQEVWEEIPSDEEMEKPKSKIKAKQPTKLAPKKKAGKAKGMKQGSIQSFFKK